MKYEEFTWKSVDRKKIFARSWTNGDAKRGVIILLHGLGEHSGRYEDWAKLFCDAGYSFLIYDQRGHGRSDGKRGHAASLDILMKDADMVFTKSDELFPGKKKIIYGHSMGGCLALNYLIHYQIPVSALIVTSPWLKLYREPGYMTKMLAGLLNLIVPSLTLANGICHNDLSHDPVVVKKYGEDPFVHSRISLKMFFELYNAGLFAMKNVFKIHLPLLMMHGKADKITSPQATETYMLNTNSKAQLRLWEDQYHELHNELINKDVFDYINNWLDTVINN